MTIIDAIWARRSVRKYKDIPVEKDKLLTLIKAAAAAPSASNRQPWEFVVVTERGLLDEIRGLNRYTNHNAPAAIAVCANIQKGYTFDLESFSVQDCSAAIENILLAALELDLGTCWLGIHPVQENCQGLRRILGIPEDILPVGVVYVGYPDQFPEPRTQFADELVHWEKY